MKYLFKIRNLYNKHVRNKRKEARFLVLIFFTLTFILARIVVYGITYHLLPGFPFSYIFYKNVHIHHLVFGIILLLIAGFIRIPEKNDNLIRISSILYGIGAALTLDEFSIWLKLNPDAYFGTDGRLSIDAVIIFTLLILFTLWYGNFVKKLFLSTLSFFGVFKRFKFIRKLFYPTKAKPIKRKPPVNLKKKSFTKKIFSYLGLGLFTFFLVTLFVPSKTSTPKSTQQVFAKAIVNAKNRSFIDATASKSGSVTPGLTISPSPLRQGFEGQAIPGLNAGPTVETTASPAADFCLNIPVLMYHHVQPWGQAEDRGQASLSVDTTVFDQQMHYLVSHGYHTISGETLVLALHNHVYLPADDVVVTLDDGYEDNYTDAFPIAKKYHILLNLMVATGLLGTHAATNYYYTWPQLQEMVNSGFVEAYDHTWSHYPTGTGDINRNQFEIMTAKQQLEQNLGKSVDIFTYPYGSGYETPWLINLLQKDGFIGAFSTIGGTIQCNSFIMGLHRNHASDLYFPGDGIN